MRWVMLGIVVAFMGCERNPEPDWVAMLRDAVAAVGCKCGVETAGFEVVGNRIAPRVECMRCWGIHE